MKRVGLLWVWGLSVLLGACGYQDEYDAVEMADVGGGMAYQGGVRAKRAAPASEALSVRSELLSAANLDVGGRGGAQAPAPVPVPSKRMIIQRGQLKLEVEAADAWIEQVTQLVEAHEGFIAQSSKEENRQKVQRGQVVLRVPAAAFETVLESLKGKAVKVESEERNGEDITEQFYDLDVRLSNQKHTERRFLAILQKADKVEDILRVERELSRVREAIEQMEGRKRFWLDRVSLATLTVSWHEPYPLVGGQPGAGFWGIVGEGFERGFRALSRGMRDLITFAIGGLPVFILLGLAGWGIVRWWRKRRGLV
ncbi:MAG: DUF4349 domain-containing protein [Candidatus Latescibacteria bacterium]|nr:DUF4349 domain-containing protein [Candidatus Latescibacterota bacterium]